MNKTKMIIKDTKFENNKWKYRILFKRNNKQFSFDFVQGYALISPPRLSLVLWSLCADAKAYNESNNLQDFMDNFCFENIKEANKLYKKCQKVQSSLYRLGFSDEDINNIQNWKVGELI